MVVITIATGSFFKPQLHHQGMLPFQAIYPGHYEHRAGEWVGEAGKKRTAGEFSRGSVAKSGGKVWKDLSLHMYCHFLSFQHL